MKKNNLVSRLLRRMRAELPFFDSAANPCLLLGSARSGTTWVIEVLTAGGDWRIMFEPFKEERVKEANGIGKRPYLRPGDDDIQLVPIINKIINGKIRHRWVDRYNNSFYYKHRMLKDIRANLLLCWIAENIKGVKILFLIRNPFNVVASQLRQGWELELSFFFGQERLVADFLKPHEQLLSCVSTPYEQAFAFWCIENYVPLIQIDRSKPENVLVIKYEKLLTGGEEAFIPLFKFFDIPLPQDLSSLMKKPSRVADAEKQINIIKPSNDELKCCNKLLGGFGLKQWATPIV